MTMVWQYQEKLANFKSHQQQMALYQAQMTSSSIQRKIDNIRQEMVALSYENFGIHDFNTFTEIDEVQQALNNRLKQFFPNMYAFTIADAHGEEIGGDIDFLVGDICRNDIKWTAQQIQKDKADITYEPMIHAKFNAFHYDMMLPVQVNGQEMVFFMSFLPDSLVQALHEHKITEHVPFIINNSVSHLIEVGLEGVRDKLLRNYYLTDKEQDLTMARELIKGTKWDVVIVENPKVFNEFQHSELKIFIITWTVIFLFWLAILIIGVRLELRRNQRFNELTEYSFQDDLTGVANRRKLEHYFQSYLTGSSDAAKVRGLIYVDINKFKDINDAYGHLLGDDFLREVAHRLKDYFYETDVVTRLGSDEFVVLIRKLSRYGTIPEIALEKVIQEIRESLSEPYLLHGEEIESSASVGGIILDGGENFDDAVRRADKQMYRDKMLFDQKPNDDMLIDTVPDNT